MTKEILRARYPIMLERCSLSYQVGWDNLMELLCEQLQHWTDKNGAPQVFIRTAKSKNGELSIDHLGGDDRQDGMILMAESAASLICEKCGNARHPDGTSCEPLQ